MTPKEYKARSEAIQEDYNKSLRDIQSIFNNITFAVEVITSRPNWEKQYKEEMLGSFIDTFDKIRDHVNTFKQEWKDCLKE